MKHTLLVTLTMVATTSAAHAGDPKCNSTNNQAAATKAFNVAISDPKSPVRVAYEKFLTAHADGVENRFSTLVPTGAKAQDFYRKPVENHWVTVLPVGTSPGTEGTSKDNAAPACVDEYLVITAVPVEFKWGGRHLYFEATVSVINGAKGAKTGDVKLLQVTELPESPAPAASTKKSTSLPSR